jgi:Protein of unknown function (DUF4079)
VPTGLPRLIAFFHPVLALVVLVFMAVVASFGLRARERRGARFRRTHRRLAPYAYVLMLANLVVGLLSTWQLRPDLELARSAHFRVGLVIALLLTIAALLSRRIATSHTARLLHPILGLIVLLLAGLQVFFGMTLLPL